MKDPNLIRKETLPVNDVLPQIVFTPKELSASSHPEAMKMIHGDAINVTSLKLQTFKDGGVRCRICGCKGEYFAKEKYADQPYFHLNLYAVKDGVEVLMTKDHIVPIAKGGRDKLNNFQTLCFDCNKKKAMKTKEQVKKKDLKPKVPAKPKDSGK
ncbi:MAG: HNH endonuclease [Oligoflexus sp.]|nr:HNH endonuclease [Oligoflexus sp.]